MRLLLLFILLALQLHVINARQQKPARIVMENELAEFSLMVNTRDKNGFFSMLKSIEAARWHNNPDEFFEKFRARRFEPTSNIKYTKVGLYGTINVSERIDGLPAFRMNMLMVNEAGRWVIQRISLF